MFKKIILTTNEISPTKDSINWIVNDMIRKSSIKVNDFNKFCFLFMQNFE